MLRKIKAYKVSDRATLMLLLSLAHTDLVLGVYCGLRLNTEVCGGIERKRDGGFSHQLLLP